MAGKTTESNGRSESKAKAGQPDLKWAVEWLVKQQGQRRAAATLGVNRKTVALALRRERLTGRMTHAVQTLLANLDDPVAQGSHASGPDWSRRPVVSSSPWPKSTGLSTD